MNSWNNVPTSFFLEERKDRYTPQQANSLRLRRLKKIDFSGQIHFGDSENTRTNMVLVKKGDLVISGINVEKGAISVYEGEEDILATIHYSSYSFDKDKIDIGYFKWFLKSRIFKEIVNLGIRGGIKTELKPKHFLSLIIPLPTLDAQILIRKKLDSVVGEIEELEKLDSKNEDYILKLQQAILWEAISGKLVPQDPNDEPASELLKKINSEKKKFIEKRAFKEERGLQAISTNETRQGIPDSWILVRLHEICSLITDGTHQTPKYTEEGRPFLSAQNIKPFRFMPQNHRWVSEIDYQNYIRNKKPEINDVLLTRVGAGIGEAAVIDKRIDFAIYVSLALVKTFNQYVDPNYLCIWLNSPRGREKSSSNTYGVGHSQGNLNLALINNFVISLPPFNEQKRIVEKVSRLMKLCDRLEEEVGETRKISESLMETVLREAFAS